MQYNSLSDFMAQGRDALAKGPIALIFVEDEVEIDSTVRHHLDAKFNSVIVLMPDAFALAGDVADAVHRVSYDMARGDTLVAGVNALTEAAPGQWFYYCYNAEYLFFPFCEVRTIGEMLQFHHEERRDAMLAYVIDLYAVIWRPIPMPSRWKMRIWTGPAITHWRAMILTTTTIQRNVSWISMAVCAGAMKKAFRPSAARLTGSRCFAPHRT